MAVKKGFKLTEVGEIPEDWDIVRVGDVIATPPQYGVNAPAEPFNPSLPIYLRITDISEDGKFLDKNIASISGVDIDKYALMPNDIILARTGASVGKSFFFFGGKKFVFAGYLIRIRANTDKIIPYFLWLQTQTNRYKIWVKENSARSGQPGLNSLQYSNYNIMLPPDKREQSAIAASLSDTDSLISSLEQLIAKKRLIKQGAMQELLTGKRRLPGFEGEWKEIFLGDALHVCHGKNQKAVDSPNGFYPIFGSGGHIGLSTQYLSEGPSVLIGRKGTIDKPQYIDSPFWTIDTLFYTDFYICHYPKFFYYLFCVIDWQKLNEASGVPSLSAYNIENIRIKVPEAVEQFSISAVLSDMDGEIAALEARLEKTRKIKKGMMVELLTGKIRLI